MIAITKLVLRGLDLFTKNDGRSVAAKFQSRAMILTSVVSGAGFFAITAFVSTMLLLQAYGGTNPPVPAALDSLFDYLIWIQGAMLGVSGGAGVLGNRQRKQEIAEQSAKVADIKRTSAARRTAKQYKHLPRVVLRRDYQDSQGRTLSLATYYNESGVEKGHFKFYELARTFKGEENVVGKTCIPEGEYLCDYWHESGSGKFKDTGIYVVNKVPGRSGILIHYGGSSKRANKYIRGCLMPYDELDGKRIFGSLQEMTRLVTFVGKNQFVLDIQ